MTLLVRDEEDILEQNISYHLNKGVDFIYAIDNGSIDSTTEILDKFVKANKLNYVVIKDQSYKQAEWVSSLARKCAKDGATHIINSDADEFWVPNKGNLKLELPLSGQLHLVRRLHYLPPSLETKRSKYINFSNFKFYIPSDLTDSEKSNIPREKIMFHASPFKIITTSETTRVAYGNHDVFTDRGMTRIINNNVYVHHFPTRSFNQFKHKVSISGEALEKNPNREVGTHMRQFYKELQDDTFEETYKNMSIEDSVDEYAKKGYIDKSRIPLNMRFATMIYKIKSFIKKSHVQL